MFRSIAKIDRTSVPALREGEWAKVVGTVLAAQDVETLGILRSPLQGLSCVHYSVTASSNGVVVARKHDCCNFYIRDESGAVVLIHAADVCAYHLQNVLQTEHKYAAEVGMPEECNHFLRTCRVQDLQQSFSFEESTIEVGATVVAIGVVARMPRTGQLRLQSDTAVHKAKSYICVVRGLEYRNSKHENDKCLEIPFVRPKEVVQPQKVTGDWMHVHVPGLGTKYLPLKAYGIDCWQEVLVGDLRRS